MMKRILKVAIQEMSQQVETMPGSDRDGAGYWEAAVHRKCRLGRKCGGAESRAASAVWRCPPGQNCRGYGGGQSVTAGLLTTQRACRNS